MGWTFAKMETFGKFLKRVYAMVSDSETKLICIKEIWYIAYVNDQWKVQPVCRHLINTGIPADIELSFAQYIIDSDVKIKYSDFASINMQPQIRKALIQKDENSSA